MPPLDGSAISGANRFTPETPGFLFLQGPVGPFFSELAQCLADDGFKVHRINFNGGDRVSWKLKNAIDFRESIEAWPTFLDRHLRQWAITDVLLFGDCRPLHRVAIGLLKSRNIRVHVFEEGYLRPHWITMEQGGVNANSSLPRDIHEYRNAMMAEPAVDAHLDVSGTYSDRARHDVIYHLGLLLWSWRFSQYQSHKPWPAAVEYKAGARRFFRRRGEQKNARLQLMKILESTAPVYLFPLQLDADSQVRFHSGFNNMRHAIQQVVDSFKKHAPTSSILVLTEHPLDNGVTDLRQATKEIADAAGLSDRIVFLEGGSPPELLKRAAAMVTVNSTIGLQMLMQGLPVHVMGTAIYNLASLTHQNGLDSFWSAPQHPCMDSVNAFTSVVRQRTQINGSFFGAEGRYLAAQTAAKALINGHPPSDLLDKHITIEMEAA